MTKMLILIGGNLKSTSLVVVINRIFFFYLSLEFQLIKVALCSTTSSVESVCLCQASLESTESSAVSRRATNSQQSAFGISFTSVTAYSAFNWMEQKRYICLA
jgi:hypothetical protein